MTKSTPRQQPADAPLLHVVDGKQVDRRLQRLQRFARFLVEPFTGAWRNRDLIVAILRRELRERFSGSVAGWVWAVVAPVISLVTYTLVFGGAVKLPNGNPAQFADRLRTFHLRRLDRLQFLHGNGVSGAFLAP